jgi:hypothetical protein
VALRRPNAGDVGGGRLTLNPAFFPGHRRGDRADVRAERDWIGDRRSIRNGERSMNSGTAGGAQILPDNGDGTFKFGRIFPTGLDPTSIVDGTWQEIVRRAFQ